MAASMTTTKTIGLCRNQGGYEFGDTRDATEPKTQLGLALKLHEEVGEVCRAPRDVDEYADVLQALQDYAALNNVPWPQVLERAQEKAEERGTFMPGKLWRSKT